jgi:hypothetical protein
MLSSYGGDVQQPFVRDGESHIFSIVVSYFYCGIQSECKTNTTAWTTLHSSPANLLTAHTFPYKTLVWWYQYSCRPRRWNQQVFQNVSL